ncbi:MAG: carbohydrate kinase family protein [Bryobacteraceae bacterium]
MPDHIVAFGEILWDIFDDSRRLGGAPLNFSLHASRMGHEAALVSAVGEDELGASARAALQRLGIDSPFVQTTGRYPTGTARVQLGEDGQVRFRIHRPAAFDDVHLTADELRRLAAWNPQWLYFGTLSSMTENSRSLLAELAESLPQARRVYDVNLRKDSFTPELVAELIARADVVKLNRDEMLALGEMFGLPSADIGEFCRSGAARFGWEAVAVTLGERGSGIWADGAYSEADGIRVTVADTVGAGDAFTAALVHGLSMGWPPHDIAEYANRVGALIASRPGGTPEWSPAEIEQMRTQDRTCMPEQRPLRIRG